MYTTRLGFIGLVVPVIPGVRSKKVKLTSTCISKTLFAVTAVGSVESCERRT